MSFTRGQIITEGLSQAGRQDLTSNARLWLNLFLTKMYKNQDYIWMIKTSDGLVLTQGCSFPSDFLRNHSDNIVINGAGNVRELEFITADKYDYQLRFSQSAGLPRMVYPNHDVRQFLFWPLPNAAYTFNLKYYYLPTLPDPTDAATDSQVPKWDDDISILIQHIYKKALQYNDDARYKEAKDEEVDMIRDSKMNSFDLRSGQNKLRLGSIFRRRY